MPEAFRYVIDVIVGVALFVALMIVFAVDWFISGPPRNTLENVKVIKDENQRGAKKLKLAVVKTREIPDPFAKGKFQKWDDMGKLLKGLGEGYRFDELTEDELIRKHEDNKLSEYDVVFLTCNVNADVDKLVEPLRNYVANGGILYASDWRYEAVAKAFKDMQQENLIADGMAQQIEADIVDPELRRALGISKIPLNFNLGDWKAAAFGGPSVQVLIKGTYEKMNGQGTATAPLMVKFPFNKGTVIFTSFHNEAQNSRIEEQLLQYLVFSLVTAGIDAELNSSLDREGFKPQGSNLLSTPPKGSIKKEYDNKHVCDLRFGLGFRNEGYKLRFNIKSPSGKQFTQDCAGTTILEVSSAEQGTWTYTVEALDAYANFAFRTTVGEKK
jgi:hypothetical protein